MTRTSDPKKAALYIRELIRQDIVDGIYEQVPGAVAVLESWTDLHDYVDANEYLEQALTLETLSDHDLCDEVSYAVDELLESDPIRL
jgi:hypothetical protein